MSPDMEAVTMLDAMRMRYAEGGAKSMESVGPREFLSAKDAKKQATLDLLERVVLQDARVSSAGPPGALAAACPLIEELDLTGNPLGGWDVPLEIAAQLEKLRFFSLVRVQLPEPTRAIPDPVSIASSFASLRTLVLNETGVRFAGACIVCAQLPKLEELQLGDHDVHLGARAEGISTPAELAAAFPSLRSLLLEKAGVSSWDEVWDLRALPKLEIISLNANPIDKVRYDAADGVAVAESAYAAAAKAAKADKTRPPERVPAPFASLRGLFLLESALASWEDVDHIDRFPALRELRLQDAPVVRGVGASVARQLVTARVGSIEALNGATVSKREREAAERFYLRQLIETYPEPLPDAEVPTEREAATRQPRLPPLGPAWSDFLAANPRWLGLVTLHGLHSAQLPRSEGGKTLAMQLVNLTLKSSAGESSDAPEAVRKLPTSLQVSKLKLVCTQVFKLDPAKQRLFYKAPGEEARNEASFMEELDDDMRTLAFYGVADGGTVVMDEWAPGDAGAAPKGH